MEILLKLLIRNSYNLVQICAVILINSDYISVSIFDLDICP